MGKEEVVLSVIASILLLAFVSSLTGLAISDPIENIYTSDTVYLWKPSQIMEIHSVSLTGSASGSGTFAAYLIIDTDEYLIASGGAGSFEEICVDSCNISATQDKYLIRYEVNDLYLIIDSINYADEPMLSNNFSQVESQPETPSFGASFSGGGAGTLGDPFIITNCTQLQEMGDALAASYAVSNDIDCSDTVTWNVGLGFDPVGTSGSPFSGNFNGNDSTVTDIYINRTTSNIGLFGYVSSTGVISNITLTVDITGINSVGSLVGFMDGGLVTNASSSDPVTFPVA